MSMQPRLTLPRHSVRSLLWLCLAAAAVALGACSDTAEIGEISSDYTDKQPWTKYNGQVEPLNGAAGDLVLYELQVRSANACSPSSGGSACAAKPKANFTYYGPGCSSLSELKSIAKSTLDDLLATSAAPNRTTGITLQYVKDVVGANAVWLMPLFPHNFQYDLPDACDDLGSPYAVRDYYHTRGTLAKRCIAQGKDEWSAAPCWGDPELRKVITSAHAKGVKVMLDLAFNHLGHEYLYYDYAGTKPMRDMLASGKDLWDFQGTYDPALLKPEIVDTPAEVPASGLAEVKKLCGSAPKTQETVRRWLMWREGFDWERAKMSCANPASLEWQLPGFYLGGDAKSPSTKLGDNYTNNWKDVKFLYNNEYNLAKQWEFFRTREFAFRVINYYTAMGVDSFRLDHANGLTENEWRYIFRKVKFYQAKRGGAVPIFLSESFHDIEQLNRVFDVLTEGYHHDIVNGKRDASYIESMLFNNRKNFLKDLSFVLLNLENHDEGRLLKNTTGFDLWRGATFYAIAAASRGTLMLLTGQEWGERWDLGFRKSDYLRGRFPSEANWEPEGDKLTTLYRQLHQARLAPQNVALRRGQFFFPRTDKGTVKDQLFAMVKYMPDCSNTLFTFFRLWVSDVEATYAVTPDLAAKICLQDAGNYRLVNALTGVNVWAKQHPNGRSGKHIREFGVYSHLTQGESFQWLRLEKLP
jgi:glycosidase